MEIHKKLFLMSTLTSRFPSDLSRLSIRLSVGSTSAEVGGSHAWCNLKYTQNAKNLEIRSAIWVVLLLLNFASLRSKNHLLHRLWRNYFYSCYFSLVTISFRYPHYLSVGNPHKVMYIVQEMSIVCTGTLWVCVDTINFGLLAHHNVMLKILSQRIAALGWHKGNDKRTGCEASSDYAQLCEHVKYHIEISRWFTWHEPNVRTKLKFNFIRSGIRANPAKYTTAFSLQKLNFLWS